MLWETDEGQIVFGLRGAIERPNSFLLEGRDGVDKFPSYVRGPNRVVLFVRGKMLAALALMLPNLKPPKSPLSYARGES